MAAPAPLPTRASNLMTTADPRVFSYFLSVLSDPDHDLQSHAEELFDCLKNDHRNALILRLVNTLRSSFHLAERRLCATLLRRLPGIENETDFDPFEIFMYPELMSKVGGSFVVDDEACMKLMGSDEADPRLRTEAVGASVGSIVFLADEESDHDHKYDCLLNLMVKTLFDLFEKREQDDLVKWKARRLLAQQVLEDMIFLARAKTGVLKTLIEQFVETMLQIVEEEGAEEKTKELAIEFVLTVAEDRKQGCGMIEKLGGGYISKLLGILMRMMVNIEDDKAWHQAGSDDFNAGESRMYVYGMEGLGRLAVALRGNAIVPNYLDVLAEFLADSDWKKRHAAGRSLMIVSEGTSKVLKKHLDKLIEKVLLLSHDSHPRVRWAAINAIGQFSKDLAPQLQQQFHQQLVRELIKAMDDFQNPRIQAQAASATLLFIQNCKSDVVKPYLKEIVSRLLEFLQKGKQMLKEGALTALASIASSTQEDFLEYYETVMPYLIILLKNKTNEYNSMLVGKAMECITMVGMAVGKKKFSNDAVQAVDVLTSLKPSELQTDNPMRRQKLLAWGRLCKCLGKEFLPYISIAMPQLLQSAQLKSYLSVDTNNPSGTDESDDERATVLEEKALACKTLCCFAAELKGGLYLWISEVGQALVPLLKFNFDKEVRSAAITAMPLLLHSTVSAVEGQLHIPGFNGSPIRKLPRLIIPALVEALNEESETDIHAKILDSLNECIQISGTQLKKTQVIQFVDGIIQFIEVLAASSSKKIEREKRDKATDLGVGEWELLKEEIEQEENVFDKIGSCLETSIKTFKAPFLPVFDKLLPVIADMWGTDKTTKERKIALKIFHDIAEQCREDAFRYYTTCLPHLFKACNDKNPEVRQIVARGIGICAEFGGSVFKPHIEVALSCLEAEIKRPSARHSNNVIAYEAAISAFGKIYYLHCERNEAFEVLATWLKHLPLKNDLQEAKVVHDQLCSMVEQLTENGFGPEDIHFIEIVRIFAEVIWAGSNLATEQTVSRMIELLKEFNQKLTPSKLRLTCCYIPLHQRNLLHSILSS